MVKFVLETVAQVTFGANFEENKIDRVIAPLHTYS